MVLFVLAVNKVLCTTFRTIFIFVFVAACGPLQIHFHEWDRDRKQPHQDKPAADRTGLSRENAIPESPQTFRDCDR